MIFKWLEFVITCYSQKIFGSIAPNECYLECVKFGRIENTFYSNKVFSVLFLAVPGVAVWQIHPKNECGNIHNHESIFPTCDHVHPVLSLCWRWIAAGDALASKCISFGYYWCFFFFWDYSDQAQYPSDQYNHLLYLCDLHNARWNQVSRMDG